MIYVYEMMVTTYLYQDALAGEQGQKLASREWAFGTVRNTWPIGEPSRCYLLVSSRMKELRFSPNGDSED